MNLQDLAEEARRLLAFQGELGLEGLDVPPELLRRPAAKPDAAKPAAASARPAPTNAPQAEPPPAPVELEEGRAAASRMVDALPGGIPPPKRPNRPARAETTLAPELQAIRDDIGDCIRCKLSKGRTNIVFGVGNPKARLMFIGEAPGRDEDLQGEPFVGAAGQLLDKMIVAMGLQRRDVYIANILKCRPPQNRDPEPDEIEQCEPFLKQQIAAVKPELIVCLGRIATQVLLRDTTPVSRLRGKWREYAGTPLLPTFHPAYLLRNPAEKKLVWEDLKQVMQRLGLKPQK